jgi:hypothetical protein
MSRFYRATVNNVMVEGRIYFDKNSYIIGVGMVFESSDFDRYDPAPLAIGQLVREYFYAWDGIIMLQRTDFTFTLDV